MPSRKAPNSFENHSSFLKTLHDFYAKKKKTCFFKNNNKRIQSEQNNMQRMKNSIKVPILLSRSQHQSLYLKQYIKSILRRFMVSHRLSNHKLLTNLVTIRLDYIKIHDVIICLKHYDILRFENHSEIRSFSPIMVLILVSTFKTIHSEHPTQVYDLSWNG